MRQPGGYFRHGRLVYKTAWKDLHSGGPLRLAWCMAILFIFFAIVALIPLFAVLVSSRPSEAMPANDGILTAQSLSGGARVGLGYSTYLGTTLESGVNQYLGMRFAQTPVGNLRWRSPLDPANEASVQLAETVSQVFLELLDLILIDLLVWSYLYRCRHRYILCC